MEDREISHPAQTVRETHAEPAGDAAGEGRDDQLVEFCGSQGVADGGQGVRVTDYRRLHLETGHPHPTSTDFRSRGGLGATGLHVGCPSQAAGDRWNDKGETRGGTGGSVPECGDQLGRVHGAIGHGLSR